MQNNSTTIKPRATFTGGVVFAWFKPVDGTENIKDFAFGENLDVALKRVHENRHKRMQKAS